LPPGKLPFFLPRVVFFQISRSAPCGYNLPCLFGPLPQRGEAFFFSSVVSGLLFHHAFPPFSFFFFGNQMFPKKKEYAFSPFLDRTLSFFIIVLGPSNRERRAFLFLRLSFRGIPPLPPFQPSYKKERKSLGPLPVRILTIEILFPPQFCLSYAVEISWFCLLTLARWNLPHLCGGKGLPVPLSHGPPIGLPPDGSFFLFQDRGL